MNVQELHFTGIHPTVTKKTYSPRSSVRTHDSSYIENNKKAKNKKTWGAKQHMIMLHKKVRLKFERRKTIIGCVDSSKLKLYTHHCDVIKEETKGV